MNTEAGRFGQRLGKNWLKEGLGREGVNAVTRKGKSGQAEEYSESIGEASRLFVDEKSLLISEQEQDI